MTANNSIPLDLSLNSERKALLVKWSASCVCEVPYNFLRGACPCALCKGNHREVTLTSVKAVENAELIDVLPQGNYAIRTLWQDAHQTGIYSYQYLWRICQHLKAQP